MTAYAPTLTTGGNINFDALESAIVDDLPTRHYRDVTGGVKSAAASSTTTLLSRSVTLSADDVIEISSSVEWSCSETNRTAQVNLVVDGSEVVNRNCVSQSTDTNGREESPIPIFYSATGLSGSISVVLQLENASGSGTMYSEGHDLNIRISKSGI